MTLSSILETFKEHDFDALSRKAKQVAAGCGQQISNPLQLQFEDWSVLDDIASSICESEMTNEDRIGLFFEYFERFPSYHSLTLFFRWHAENLSISDQLKWDVWRRLASYLDSEAAFADPITYLLWVDLFEDQRTAEEAWRGVVSHCASEQSLKRLLDVSGPVPFALKEPLYLRLLHDKKYHTAVLRSLHFSAHDVYGQFNRERALNILKQLDIDRESVEFQMLNKMIQDDQGMAPCAGSGSSPDNPKPAEGPSLPG